MQDETANARGHFSRGVVASVTLHALLAAAFFLHLPADFSKPEEDVVKVEILPAPEMEPAAKPPAEAEVPLPVAKAAQPKADPPADTEKPAKAAPPRQPQAFESGGAPAEEKAAEAEEANPPPSEENASLPETKPITENEEKAGPKASGLPKDVTPPKADIAAKTSVAEGPANALPPEIEEPAKRAAIPSVNDDRAEKTSLQSEKKLDEMKKAKSIYSTKMLADPRVKQALGRLPPERRIVQLCSIEALEQIRRSRANSFPDLLVPFGISRGLIEDHVLNATGGAYRSHSNWFNVDFRCEVDADTTRIVAFSFNIGSAVPKSEWPARRLIVDDGAGLAKALRSLSDDLQP
ncbi:DUF930 domain-containing protein [Rhizobiaceae bacterium n13]|uniref:DUF930 domain-containing protein n=1 Tax=Ferirhizobium litorale TaxID=2927786 RepID=A0AAE3Q9Z5_9HYPH|nr:DUF930 domain-containing protein [Fererhizobium litorale]MDI7860937.1 DUF930 domain-containing protein [Fererhizobium litorale]MDI7921085.1 DUF930 domain-containing protein [Fererhizobium litorale]